MSDEMRFEPAPEVAFLCSDTPTKIVDMVVRHCPPGTPALPRPNRPHLPTTRIPAENKRDDSGDTGARTDS
jgi:hypothetical protein